MAGEEKNAAALDANQTYVTGIVQGSPAETPIYETPIKKEHDFNLARVFSMADDPAEAQARYESATVLAKRYGMDVSFVLDNFDEVLKSHYGNVAPAKTVVRALTDSVQSGLVSINQGYEAFEYATKNMFGTPTPESDAKFLKAMADYDSQIADLNFDKIDRNIVTKLFKLVGNNAVQIASTAAMAALTGGVGAVAGEAAKAAGISAARAAIIKTALVTAGNFAQNLPVLQGYEYKEMRKKNIDHRTAVTFSYLSGGIQAAMETFIGVDSQIARSVNKAALPSAVENLIERLHVNGTLTTAAAEFATRAAATSIGEGVTEAAQQGWAGIVSMAAESLMADGVVTDPTTAEELSKSVFDNFLAGVVVGGFYGLGPAAINSRANADSIMALAKYAESGASRESVIETAKGMDIEATPEVLADMGAKVYDTVQNQQNEAALKDYRGNTTEEPAAVQRQDSGELWIKERKVSDTEEQFNVGDPTSGSVYGSINVNVDEDAKTVTITDTNIEDKYASIIPELIQHVADQHYDKQVVVDPGVDEFFAAQTEAIVAEAGALQHNVNIQSPERAKALSRVRAELTGAGMADRAEQNLATQMLSNLPMPFIKNLSFKVGSDRMMAGAAGKSVFTINDLKKTTGSIIYLAENQANPVVVAHEVFHLYRQAYKDTPEMKAVEAAYGIADGNWSVENNEAFVNDGLKFLTSGEAPTPQLKTFFQKMSAWLKKLWNGAIGNLDMHPDVRKAFTTWMTTPQVDEAVAAVETMAPEEAILPIPEEAAPAPDVVNGMAVGSPDSSPLNPFRMAIDPRDVEAAIQALGQDDLFGISTLQKKMFADGSWAKDQGLVAMVMGKGLERRLADGGKEASLEEVVDYLSTAFTGMTYELTDLAASAKTVAKALAQISENLGTDVTTEIFNMSEDELNNSKQGGKQQWVDEAKRFETVDAWTESFGVEMKQATASEQAYYNSVFTLAHSITTPLAYPNRNDFTKSLTGPDGIETFLKNVGDAVYKKGDERVIVALRHSPQIYDIVKKARKAKMDSTLRSEALSVIGNNEAQAMLIQSQVLPRGEASSNLAAEAKARMSTMPEMIIDEKSDKPALTAMERDFILESMTDETLAKAAADKSITIESLNRKLEAQKKMTQAEAAKFAKSKKNRADTRARHQVKKYLKSLQSFIDRPAPATAGHEAGRMISLAQALLNGGNVQAELRSIVFQLDPSLAQSVVNQLSRISQKKPDERTMADMEDVATLFDAWIKNGKDQERMKKRLSGIRLRTDRQEAVLDMEKNRNAKPITDRQSQTFKKAEEKRGVKRVLTLDVAGFTRPSAYIMDKFAKDGASRDNPGIVYDMIINQAQEKMTEQYRNQDRRQKEAVDYLKKTVVNGQKMKKRMFDQVVVKGASYQGKDLVLNRTDLLGYYMLIGENNEPGTFNQNQREATIYGNLFDVSHEKRPDAEADETASFGNDYMKAKYKERLAAMQEAFKQLSVEDKKLAGLMMEAMANMNDWNRFATSVYKLTGKEPKFEKHYFPMMISSGGLIKDTSDIGKQLQAMGMNERVAMEMGMTIERNREIQPKNRQPVLVDSWKVFFQAIERQEHLINFGEHVKHVKSVLFDQTNAGSVVEHIRANAGEEGVEYLREVVDSMMNPNLGGQEMDGHGFLNFMRGAQIVSNLSFRASTFLMQMVTSPLPTIIESPGQLVAVSAEAWSSGNLTKWYESVEAKSPILKNRQLDVVKALLEGLQERGVQGALKSIGQTGMIPMVFADRFSVAVSWEAVRRAQVSKLTTKAMTDRVAVDMAAIEQKARQYADEFIVRTQPSSETMFRAPVYRDMNVYKQLVLQFTQPLNVIWNNIRYDMPQALREKAYGKVVGYIMAYGLSGLAMGAIRAMRGRGPEEDDEERAKIGYWVHAGLSQGIESVPLIGDIVSSFARQAITGEKSAVFNDDSATPALSDILDSLSLAQQAVEGDLTDKQKAAMGEKAWTGVGSILGLPTRAVSEYTKAGLKLFNGEGL